MLSRAATFFTASNLALVAFLMFGWNSLVCQPQPIASPSRKLALLVGINRYKAQQIPSLEGPVNDVHRVQAVLIGKFGFAEGDITLLTDERATHAGIVDQFRRMTEKAKP